MYKRPAGRFFILVDGPHRDTVRLSFVKKRIRSMVRARSKAARRS